jgi:hypothetical protein
MCWAVFRVADGSRPKAGAHHRQLSGSPVQLQSEAVRGVRLRAQSRISFRRNACPIPVLEPNKENSPN